MNRLRGWTESAAERRREPEPGWLRLVARSRCGHGRGRPGALRRRIRLDLLARAAACALSLGALAPGLASALEPDLLPEAMWWRTQESSSLARDPLTVMTAPPGVGIEAEWAPLYRGRDGARYESARRSLRTLAAFGSWRFANELDQRTLALRGGEGAWRLDAEQPLRVLGTAGVAGSYRRIHMAVSAGGTERASRAVAVGASADLAPGWEAEARWSRVPDEGQLHARWDDFRVAAPGRWIDRRIEVGLAGTLERVRWGVFQSSLDRHARRGGTDDRLEPKLAWRSSRIDLSGVALGARWATRLEHGEGRQGFQVWRGTAPYVTVIGPVVNSVATVSCGPAAMRWAARAWIGRWRGDVNGALALWPFDELALIAGTRRVAESSARLAHFGMALERMPSGSGLDGGVALWRLAPRADYEGWQATAMGMGRDDPSSGSVSIRSAWAGGVRLAATAQWSGIALRLEGVQWIPLRVERTGGPKDGSTGGDIGAGASASKRRERSEWGGTILRLGLSASR